MLVLAGIRMKYNESSIVFRLPARKIVLSFTICFLKLPRRPGQEKLRMFQPEEARAFMEKYRAGNRKIMEKYFHKSEASIQNQL